MGLLGLQDGNGNIYLNRNIIGDVSNLAVTIIHEIGHIKSRLSSDKLLENSPLTVDHEAGRHLEKGGFEGHTYKNIRHLFYSSFEDIICDIQKDISKHPDDKQLKCQSENIMTRLVDFRSSISNCKYLYYFSKYTFNTRANYH
jgi:hypothetical protein